MVKNDNKPFAATALRQAGQMRIENINGQCFREQRPGILDGKTQICPRLAKLTLMILPMFRLKMLLNNKLSRQE
jgi:hypothetical protein